MKSWWTGASCPSSTPLSWHRCVGETRRLGECGHDLYISAVPEAQHFEYTMAKCEPYRYSAAFLSRATTSLAYPRAAFLTRRTKALWDTSACYPVPFLPTGGRRSKVRCCQVPFKGPMTRWIALICIPTSRGASQCVFQVGRQGWCAVTRVGLGVLYFNAAFLPSSFAAVKKLSASTANMYLGPSEEGMNPLLPLCGTLLLRPCSRGPHPWL